MNYIDKHLMSGEKIIYQTKLNWTEYIKGFLFLLFGLMLYKISTIRIDYYFFTVGVLTLIYTYLKINSSEFAVTDKRVLIKVGILKTQSLETMLNKIEGIHVEQGIIAKMNNFETFTI